MVTQPPHLAEIVEQARASAARAARRRRRLRLSAVATTAAIVVLLPASVALSVTHLQLFNLATSAGAQIFGLKSSTSTPPFPVEIVCSGATCKSSYGGSSSAGRRYHLVALLRSEEPQQLLGGEFRTGQRTLWCAPPDGTRIVCRPAQGTPPSPSQDAIYKLGA